VPHVVKAARIVLMNPSNQASVEHFELLKKQWLENAEKLRSLVDEAIDTAAFIRANGASTTVSYVSLHVVVLVFHVPWLKKAGLVRFL